ncbi:MAG: glycoside hydrolase family 78 protein [Oscillospiraceae bacterium]|nr:glycoside hydrolase family 78 protein [Oscillospiraceae bacterium]
MKRFITMISLVLSLNVLFMMTALAAPAAKNAGGDSVLVTNLKLEYETNPMGFDVEKPRFSWSLESDMRAVKQTSYRIIAAKSADYLSAGQYVWDSGIVNSDSTFGIYYEGTALEPTTRYYWKVDVQTNKGAAVCNETAFFETGFLDPTPSAWSAAQWLTKPTDTTDNDLFENEPLYRKEFVVEDKEIVSARLYATSRGYYEFSINGKKVGDSYLTPGWSDYKFTIMYQTYDVADMLKRGAVNAIGGQTSQGWFSGPHQLYGYNMYGDRQSLIGKLVVKYADGSEDIIVTDGTWFCAGGPIKYADNYRGETYDARDDRSGWDTAGYDDSDWLTPHIADWADASAPNTAEPSYIGQLDPPIRKVAEFSARDVTPAAYPEHRTYDFGQNIAGFVSIKVKGKPGDTILIKHGEMLNTPSGYRKGFDTGRRHGNGDGPVGTLYRENLRDQQCPVAYDYYTLKSDEWEVYTPRFTFHGFRYIEVTQVDGSSVEIDLNELKAIAISSDNTMTSSFETSNPKVNQLYSNIVWGMRGNFVGVPTDCPNRDERLGYTGDTQVFARTASYLQNANQFLSRWLRDLRDYQSTQTGDVAGLVPVLIPAVYTEGFEQWSNGWGDAAVIVPWQLYQQYGDEQIIKDSYTSMKAWCDFLLHSNRTLNNLRRSSDAIRDNNYGDWLTTVRYNNSDKQLSNSLYMAYSCKLFAKMAAAIGDPYGDASTYEERARDIANAVIEKFRKSNGGLKRHRQTAYAMMLYFGLDDEASNAVYAEKLSENVTKNGNKLTSGFIGVGYLAPALSQNGHAETAFLLLEQEEYPSWIYSINQGATTTWERWNSYTTAKGFGDVGMNSFNHYSLGSIGDWLFSGVLGIERDEANPGFRRFVLDPQYGGTITYAKGHYDAISGTIKSAWELDRSTGVFSYSFTVPANTSAIVYVPSKDTQSPINCDGADAAKAEGVTFIGYDETKSRAIYEISSGSYEFISVADLAVRDVKSSLSDPAAAVSVIAAIFAAFLSVFLPAQGATKRKRQKNIVS